ncbi:hypothetical protein [Acidimangrovimonas sediminis]|uniref:hypothetical protein n=1 Tax=Acidimangrovimonas sediminis TaxID=2056283 RepID=UPI000C805313|nr:hypothetical protein [Acidimangrovimonas sediminis]
MEKVWNVATRSYDYHATGLYIDGIDYDPAGAMKKWESRGGKDKCRKSVAQQIIRDLIQSKASFAKHHLWLEEMERRIVDKNAAMVETAKGRLRVGLKGTISYADIPAKFRPGVKTIIESKGNHLSRGAHKTNPANQAGGFGQFIEYHLAADKEGRAVTAVRNGEMFIYYSTTHAAATYNYQLVTFPIRLDCMDTAVDVPLSGGNRDKLLEHPA